MKNKLYLAVALMSAGIAIFYSCKKNDTPPPPPQTAAMELNKSQDTISYVTLATLPVEEETNFIEVKLANGEEAQSDIVVKLVKDQALVTAYNTLKGTSYIDLPAALFTITSPGGLDVTIPKGQKSAWLKFKISKGAYDYASQYAVGYTIQSVSGSNTISPARKNLIVALRLRNKYDGLWTSNGTLSDIANGALGPYVNAPIAFVTTDVNKITMYNMVTTVGAWFNQPFQPITSAGAFSVYGGWAPEFTFNAADNITTATNFYGNPNPANTRGTALDATGVNNYSFFGTLPVIRVKYIMTQPSVVPAPPHHRTFFDMTFYYSGPRP